MAMLGKYRTTTELSNKDAGSCKWCFGIRDGEEYFIKEFIRPKYPTEDSVSSPERIRKKKADCEVFEQKMARIYRSVNEQSDGNAVRIMEFFRIGAKYYMAMPKIKSVSMDIAQISELAEPLKRKLCTVIAHALSGLHGVSFVHSDIKHSNVIFTYSSSNMLTAKLIDYDAGFFEDTPPARAEEVAGDGNYFSPEAWIAMSGGEINLTCKLDIFALGVLFHEYYTGQLPDFDRTRYSCAGEARADGGAVEVSWDMPMDIRRLLVRMLDADPAKRPDAQEVFTKLRGIHEMPDPAPEPDPDPKPIIFVPDPPGRPGWHKPTLD